jgi:hypothetical protein
MPLAQVSIHYNVGCTHHMTLFCKVYLYPIAYLSNNTKGTPQFFLFELNGRHSNITTPLTDFSF